MEKVSLKTITAKLNETGPHTWLIVILLAAVCLRVYFFIGLNFADDPWYVFLANKVCEGSFNATDLGGLRLMMIYPLAFLFKNFGINNASASIYPMLCSAGTIIIAYLSGSLLFNIRTGLIAALLLCFYPLNVIYASWFMPDIPVAFFTSLAILLFLAVYKKERTVSEFRKHLLLYLSGFSIGISYLANIRSIIGFFVIAPIALIWLWKKRLNKRKLLAGIAAVSFIFIGFATTLIFEGVYHQQKSGDFFIRYHRVSSYYSGKSGFLKEGVNSRLDFYPRVMFNLDHKLRFIKNSKTLIYGYFYYFFIIASVFLLIKRDRRAYIPLWWFISLFFYQQFGSMSFKEYIPIHRLDRHLTVVTIPALLVIAASLSDLLGLRVRRSRFVSLANRFIAIGILAFLLTTSLRFTKAIASDMRAASYDMKEIYNFLKQYPGKNIYADPGVLSHLHFYFQFRNEHLRHNILNIRKIKPDSFVVLDGTRGFIENPRLIRTLPGWAREPNASWKLVKVVQGPRLGIFGSYDPKIYHTSMGRKN